MTTISLSKGQNISLTKQAPGLTKIRVGLGWDGNSFSGANFDLDASAILLGADGKAPSNSHFVYFGAGVSPCGSVVYGGDNQNGQGEGDDETITIDLTALPESISRIIIAVNIHEAIARNQRFGDVKNAYIRFVNELTDEEMARFDLTEDASTELCMIFGEVYRHNGEWKCKAIGQGYKGGLVELGINFGLVFT